MKKPTKMQRRIYDLYDQHPFIFMTLLFVVYAIVILIFMTFM